MIHFRFTLLVALSMSCAIASAQKPKKEEEPKPAPVEARLLVKKSKYVLPKEQHGKAFRKRIEDETDTDKLPPPQKVSLVLELKNVSQEDVMIWPRGAIIYPDLTVEGPGVVQPENLRTISGESSGTSVQPTIAPGKTHRLTIKSLNPNGGTTWFYWCEPGEYTITASYTVHTGLPPFPFTEDSAGRFLWPGSTSEDCVPFRYAASDDDRRSLDEIALPELIGLVRDNPVLVSSDDPALALAREIGLARLARGARERLEEALGRCDEGERGS